MEEKKKNIILNVPNLRFQNSSNWSQYKLNSLSKIYDGTHQTPDYKDQGIKFVSVEDIKNLYETSKFITAEAFSRDFKVCPKQNDILMTRIGDIGTPALVTNDEPLAYYVSLALIKPQNNLDSVFAKYLIESTNFQHELWKKTIHVAFPKKINKEEIGECRCFIPDINTQQKIGKFLSMIEKRIETQNKIIKTLESLRNSIRKIIFVSMHELNVRLGSLCKIETGKLDANKAVPNGKYRFYTCAENYSYIDNYAFDCEAILISGNGANVGYVHQYTGKFNAYQRTYVLSDFKGITSAFLKIYLDAFLKQRIGQEKNCGNMPYIKLSTLSEMIIKLPNLNKQKQIASIINSLSDKIDNEIKLLSNYQKQKQYLLNNLFI